MSQRKFSRDLMKDAAYNKAKLNQHLEAAQYQEDFAAAKRVFWIGIALVIISAIVQTQLL